jgi:hypothetical protein
MPQDNDKPGLSKPDRLAAILDEFEDDDLEEEMEGKDEEERMKIIERHGATREQTQAAFARLDAMIKAKGAQVEKKKDEQPVETPAVKPAATPKAAPEKKSNVVDITVYRQRVVRWAAVAAAVAAAVTIALFKTDQLPEAFYPVRPPVTTAPLSTGADPVTYLRAEAFEQCATGEYVACLDSLDKAKQMDPQGDNDPKIVKIRAVAKRELERKP